MRNRALSAQRPEGVDTPHGDRSRLPARVEGPVVRNFFEAILRVLRHRPDRYHLRSRLLRSRCCAGNEIVDSDLSHTGDVLAIFQDEAKRCIGGGGLKVTRSEL